MKKQLLFPLALVILAPAAAAVRHWQRLTAFEPDTGLLTPNMPATWVAVTLAVAAAGMLFLLARRAVDGRVFRGYLDGFSAPHPGMLSIYVIAGALALAAGVLGIMEYRQAPDARLSGLILSVCLIPTGISLGLVGWLNCQRQEAQGRFAWPLLLPGYCGCMWLIYAYQSHAGNPNVMEYFFYFLGMVCAVSCCYVLAAFSFEKAGPVACLWLGGMALVLLSMCLVDFAAVGATAALLTVLAYALYVAGQMACLLIRCGAPAQLEPWTPPEPDAPEEAENEVTEHE